MKNKLSWLLLTVSSSTLPLLTLSATTEATENNNSSGTVSPDFDQFRDVIDKKIKEFLTKIVEKKIEEYKVRSRNLLSEIDNNGDNFAEKIIESLYMQYLSNFLSKNKDEILTNYLNKGIVIVYPRIIANNKTLSEANIDYNGESYTEVKIADSDQYNYEYFIDDPDINREITVPKIVNSNKLEDINSKSDKYFSELEADFDRYFANKEDFPRLDLQSVIDKDGTVNIDKNPETNVLELTVPKNYQDWDDYIIRKIKPRFTAYDLRKNKEIEKEDVSEEEEKPEEQPILPSVPEIVPPATDSEANVDPFDAKIGQENVGRFSPYINYEFYDSINITDDAGRFNQNEEELSKFFYFNNPINTRFEYKVIKLKNVDNKLFADVKIKDTVNNKEITYESEVKKESTKKKTILEQVKIDTVNEIYLKFYDSLGLNRKIDLKKLGNTKILSNTVFNMIFESIRIYNDSSFIKEINKIISSYLIQYKDLSADALYDKVGKDKNSDFRHDIKYLLLSSHFSSYINRINFWNYLSRAYQELFNEYVSFIDTNKDVIVYNIDKIIIKNDKTKAQKAQDKEKIEKVIRALNKDINYLFGIINISNPAEIISEYDEYLSQVKRVQNQFRNISTVTSITKKLTNEDLSNSENITQRFTEAFRNLEINPVKQPKSDLFLLRILGYIILVVGILLSAITSALQIFKYKRNKNTNSKIKASLVLSWLVSALTIITSIILILIGNGGL
ncbi:hypothetical protein MADP07_00361 [Mycoplasma anatis]|uniref:Transmembrane protein n=1 Tax=Mycoplasmopsis anatis TaxID=171279 RepID=A0A9Q3QDN4_9BACT|nr:hypothetical protein [Mycoplasmopsis anatis]MBW0595828.1 hypothetical protein [Mycoplasmopsis anatis]MBW0597253.1 hypothetical protein [Mycoplasmopsis anatis]MBW0600127.1 hypothetical protein [Mycoplasmopsis anatis]MBW0602638.1 hypothetical protein [Mycoplasmopsis anatis]MBW0604043.1 hypothetical protein [Mycoplasmopsis anatis]